MADVIVRCRELTKVYDLYGEEKDRLKALLGLRANVKKFPALCGVTQDFHRGEIVGLAGLNGSGKSTLALEYVRRGWSMYTPTSAKSIICCWIWAILRFSMPISIHL